MGDEDELKPYSEASSQEGRHSGVSAKEERQPAVGDEGLPASRDSLVVGVLPRDGVSQLAKGGMPAAAGRCSCCEVL